MTLRFYEYTLLMITHFSFSKTIEFNGIATENGIQSSQNRSDWQKFPISYIPIIECSQEIWKQTQLSASEKYDAMHVYPPKHSFGNLIDRENIELIINENDNEATKQFVEGFKNENFVQSIQFDKDKFYKFFATMGGNLNLSTTDFDTDSVDINGYGSTYWNADPLQGALSSTGMNAEYFKLDRFCASLKNCNVYPHFRVVHKSQSSVSSFSCNEILNDLLPPIYECIDEHGVDSCDMLIDSGYFRDVFKVKSRGKYVVVKIMRPAKYDDYSRDLQRNVRETILLHYLENEEKEFIKRYGFGFASFGGEQRAFPYVRELGHCLYPTYISVSEYYDLTLDALIESDVLWKQSIDKLMQMALDIAKGTEVIHNLRGGGYIHSDIAIDQYMIDKNGRVLLNDFNRGKFSTFRFAEDFDGEWKELVERSGVVKCVDCGYASDGRNRSPEELVIKPLTKGIDVYSTAMVIWSLFSGTRQWTKPSEGESSDEFETYEDILYLVHDTVRRPPMPDNMPFALKELLRAAIGNNPKNRLSAREFRRRIQDIAENLSKYTRNQQDISSGEAMERKLFHESKTPKVPLEFAKKRMKKH